jgi:hypothetical protein
MKESGLFFAHAALTGGKFGLLPPSGELFRQGDVWFAQRLAVPVDAV